MVLTKLIPASVRREIRRWQRFGRDVSTGDYFRMAVAGRAQPGDWPEQVVVSQPVRMTAFFENKCHNLALGARLVSAAVIQPGQMMSFWRLTGAPTYNRGFKEGRNLVNGQIRSEAGGGLCQLASILYHTALCAGLGIAERHHHSIDIYQEAERFTPLGADATVVYGYKDLRIVNTLPFPVRFNCWLDGHTLHCAVNAAHPVTIQTLEFKRTDESLCRTVETWQDRPPTLLTTSVYRV